MHQSSVRDHLGAILGAFDQMHMLICAIQILIIIIIIIKENLQSSGHNCQKKSNLIALRIHNITF